jgi:hypothetical protein
MSRCKVIIIAIISFYSSSSLMGMESLFSWFKKTDQSHKYSKVHNDKSEEFQIILLFQNADITDKYGTSVPNEVKDLIRIKSYYLLHAPDPSTYMISPENLANLNNKQRIKTYKGAKIRPNELVTMTDEGRKVFERLTTVIPHKNDNDIFEHVYTQNSVQDIVNLENCVKNPEDKQSRQLAAEKYGLLLPHEYDDILKLPLNVRCKIGESSTVNVIDKEHVSLNARWDTMRKGASIGYSIGTCTGTIYSLAYTSSQYSKEFNILYAMPIKSVEDYYVFSKKWNELCDMKFFSKLNNLTLGLCSGTALGAIAGIVIARDHPHNRVYNVVEKPLITSEEKAAIEKTKKAKIAYEKTQAAGIARREYDTYINKQLNILKPCHKIDNDLKEQLKPKQLAIEKF